MDHDNESSLTLAQFDRRSLFKGFGALLGASIVGSHVEAQQAASGLVKRELTAKERNGTPAVFDAKDRGPWDLDDPLGNHMATLKVTNNLVGKKSYVAMMGRVYLGPQGKPGAAVHGLLGLWTWHLQWPDPAEYPNQPKGTVVQRAMFTGIIVDPTTFTPVDHVYNHYLKKDVETHNSLFAESYLFLPNGSGRSVDRPEFMNSREKDRSNINPHVQWGDKISIYLAGLFQNEGPNQPRMDGSIWSTDYKQFMDPRQDLVVTDYNFAGLMRAWERPWIGVGKDDNAQLLFNVKGTKLHAVEQFPEIVKTYLVKKYPDRV